MKLSVLDLASIGDGESVGQSLQGCVAVAQAAERLGYTQIGRAHV